MEQLEDRGRSYRRGTILGWTLAEVFLLIVFILLLLFGQMARKHANEQDVRTKLTAMSQQLDEEKRSNAALLMETSVLKSGARLPRNFDNLFHELVLYREKAANLQQQLATLAEKDRLADDLEQALSPQDMHAKNTKAELEALARKAAEAEKAKKILKSHGVLGAPSENLAEAVEQVSARADLFNRLANEGRITPEKLGELTDRSNQDEHQLNDCRGSLANMQQRFVAIGRGTENPACYADSNGHPQYLFDVALTSGGVIVRKNDIPGREEDERRLPIQAIEFEQEISIEDFLDETDALFRVGQLKKILNVPCRFFVRVYDETKPDEKEIYKSHLSAVEGHFYKALATGSFEQKKQSAVNTRQ